MARINWKFQCQWCSYGTDNHVEIAVHRVVCPNSPKRKNK